ncbi:Pkinase-domain-containing protein [Neoconidiobolus thromboides FSU 785]|nr:Pkinase-domain-containing protein [Neoconidiobolus thromboides FSU 785]
MAEDLTNKLKEIEAKISHEETVLAGFKHMLSAHSKPDIIAQCEDGIQQSETILSYFRSEREKLISMIRRSAPQDQDTSFTSTSDLFKNLNKKPTQNLAKGKLSVLDFRKHNPPLSREMITYRIQEIQHRLEIEEKVKAAYEKFQGTTALNKDLAAPDSQNEAILKLADSNDKIRIFNLALRELKPLTLATLSLEDPEEQNLLKPGLRRPMTGTIKIKLLSEQNLQNIDPITSTIVFQIDGKTRGKIKLNFIDRKVDHFVAKVHKANEMELHIVNEYKDKPPSIVGLLWIPLAEVSDDIRKRNAGNIGWAPADASGQINRSKTVVRSTADGSDFEVIEDWFKVEPVGKLLLRMNFIKSNVPKKPQALLGRQGALRVGKEAVAAEIKGHRFARRVVYRPLTCSVCNKLTVNSTEYHCQDCRYFCHIACAPDALTTCITRSNDDNSGRKSLNKIYNIPHRFESSTTLGANWCCHCGQMLSLVRDNGKKCIECGITSHIDCMHFVPNFCGLSREMAKQLVAAERRSKSDAGMRPPTSPIKPSMITALGPPIDSPTDQKPSPSLEVPGVISHNKVNSVPFIEKVDERPAITELKIPPLTTRPTEIAPVKATIGIPKPASKPRKVTIKDYNLLVVLGRGNFGKVMLGEVKETKELVAIKILKKDAAIENDEVDALKSEREVFKQTTKERHPFLVHMEACFTSNASIFFVMEYVIGGDLMSLIQRLRNFTPTQTRFYTVEVILALEFLHKRNIIYRDLKLDNIMLCGDGHIKVADYGLCKLNMPYGSITSTFCGTPEFMAPEILNERKYGSSVDWWSLGVLMYQMTLGQSPFTGADDMEIFDSIIEDEVLYPLSLPRTTVSILERLLTKDPKKRIGCGPSGSDEIKQHPYFRDIDWDAHFKRQVTPPYIPKVKNGKDVTNFDEEFTSQPPTLTPTSSMLTPVQQKKFEGFSFYHKNL